MTKLPLVLSFAAVTASHAAAQSPARVSLPAPDATIREPLTLVRSVRELGDGRILILDWLEQRVMIGDFRTGSVTDRNRVGSGPQEYRLAGALHAWRGDSTLLVDNGNNRLAVLDRDGVIRRTFRPSHAAALSPGGADSSGRIYFAIPPWHADTPLRGDTIALAVMEPGRDSLRVLGHVHGSTPSQQKPGEGPRIPYVVFAAQDTWTVSRAGRIAIVRDDDYHVEWLDTRGRARGPRNAVSRSAVTPRDRREAVRTFASNAATGGRDANGGAALTSSPASTRTDEALQQLERASTFAATLPPFRPGSGIADGAGRLWVARWQPAGQNAVYDVFDAAGAAVAVIDAGAARRIVAIGRAHAYVVYTDDDDLQHIERRPLPPVLLPASRD
jgi:hypothetical protein